jgi:6-phospho-beta-glucosidase
MKLAVIGGSAFSTPGLIRFLINNKGSGRMEVVLSSRSMKRLEAVKRASILAGSGDIHIDVEEIRQTRWPHILDGADCVLIQVRVGGYEGRRFDESFPHKYGLCGDEGLGPGGLSAGWRTWPTIANLLQAIVTFCPQAFVILMTSPLGLLVRASHEFVQLNLVGICELPWTTLQDLILQFGLQNRSFDADYLGVNHLGWFFNFRRGSDCLSDEIVRSINGGGFPSTDCFRALGCFPTRYLRMHYHQERVFSEQVSQKPSRAEILTKLQDKAYRAYSTGSEADINEILNTRSAPWYPHAIGPLILAMAGKSTAIPFFLSVRNGSFIDLLKPDDVLECRHEWRAGKLVRSQLSGVPPQHLAETLLSFVLYERVATKAIMTRSVPLLLEALCLHPWTKGHRQIRAIANDIVSYNERVSAAVCQ